jgi:hypothetical protein
MSPGVEEDKIIVVFQGFGDARPAQTVFSEAMQEGKRGFSPPVR